MINYSDQPVLCFLHFREKNYVVLEGRFVRLRNDWKARLLKQASKDVDILNLEKLQLSKTQKVEETVKEYEQEKTKLYNEDTPQ